MTERCLSECAIKTWHWKMSVWVYHKDIALKDVCLGIRTKPIKISTTSSWQQLSLHIFRLTSVDVLKKKHGDGTGWCCIDLIQCVWLLSAELQSTLFVYLLLILECVVFRSVLIKLWNDHYVIGERRQQLWAGYHQSKLFVPVQVWRCCARSWLP